VEELSAYMARGAIAVLRALRRLAPGVQFSLKYPNDVLALKNHKWMKIGGILVEHEFQGDRCLSSVIGIGVNVLQESFPETIRDTGTSLHQHGINLDVSVVIDHVKWNITDLRTRPWREVHDEWVVELDIVGRTVRLAGDEGAWTVTKVLDDGRLAARNMVSSMERTISDGDTVRYLD
jgi:biotin-(acetyl-CoA carboxylase) ligase